MKYHILTLGCPKNQVDSEGMDGILSGQGHTAVDDVAAADVIIVNTCSFIAAAREETLAVLRDLGARKDAQQTIVAAGCMAQSHGEQLAAVAGVDLTLGTQQWMRIGELLGQPANGIAPIPLAQPLPPVEPMPASYMDWRSTQIRRTRSAPSAYLKISDGCNLRCAFCTIPSFKGNMRSKPVAAVLGEAGELVAKGSREIILVAQHLTDYGRDLGLQDGLAHLLDELCSLLPADVWVRLMYAYPHGISERLIATMARHRQICPYLDMPLQHAHPDTLRRMRRPPDIERTRRLIGNLRAALPDITLRSTFIVGFPGETRTEFETLLEFLADVKLDRVGAFRYSQEPGTAAANLTGQLRPRLIERRWHELMQLQQQISQQSNQRWLGREVPVLVEDHGQDQDGATISIGRSWRDAPEVDGQVFIAADLPIGTLQQVRVNGASEYDLWAEVV